MRIVRTDEDAAVPTQFLKADPDVRLRVLDQVAEVNVPVGVGQRGGDENLTRHEADVF